MDSYKCPYCNQVAPIIDSTFRVRKVYFQQPDPYSEPDNSCMEIVFFKCPNCCEFTVHALGSGDKVSDINMRLRPLSCAIQFPDYIPRHILNDYEEACSIANLSPKASATLSRRCLQNMIRDFWNISKETLYKEIESLDSIISPNQKKVLHSLRQIGNIGAHPEADVNTIIDIEPDDAMKLIKVIEFFIDKWYIDRYEQEQLFNDINGLNDDLQSQRSTND